MNLRFLGNKEVKNAGWMIGGKIAQMLLQLAVGVLSARYLGPDNYGLINYATAYVTLFTPLCTLGINSVLVKALVDEPDSQGNTIGTTILMRAISSAVSMLLIVGLVWFLDKDSPAAIYVTAICSVSLLFHVFDTINYWFQAQYRSKIPSIITLIGYIATSAYRIILLIQKASVYWFALASTVDYIVIAMLLLIMYRRCGGQRLSASVERGRALLGKSHHFILSGMMVVIYGQTDKLMLKYFLDESEVGYYSAAATICAMWTFVLTAIIDSVYPTIMRLHAVDMAAYERKNRQLYCIVFYCSMFVSLCLTLLGKVAIGLLYGAAYLPAIVPLQIITWYTAFSYLGVARNAWIVCEGKQKYLKYIYAIAAGMNVCLNVLLIPLCGAAGAAAASLITQIMTSIGLSYFIPAMRPNAKLMLQAITFQGLKEK